MASPLHFLEGLTVSHASIVHDYVQLSFGEQVGLSIYNEISLDPPSTQFELLVGKMVVKILESEEAIVISFLDGSSLEVDLHPVAYGGPEALQLNRQGEPPVIWN